MLKTAIALLLTGAAAFAVNPVPRQSAELSITLPSGEQRLLSSYKGKVVLLQFLFTYCEHCQRTAQEISKVQKDLGPKGFQALGVAFNDQVLTPDKPSNNRNVLDFTTKFAQFPVGIAASRQAVMNYL